jgi:hypothetical protein
LTAFYKPWFLFGEGVLPGPWPVRKVAILASFVGPPVLALLAVALAIYYAVTGRRGAWWLASVALTVVVAVAGYQILKTLMG